MIKRCDQLQFLRQQHAIAEHVARHVATAGHLDRVGLDVDALFEKVALDRNPCALGGNAHRLVVVAVRTAAGEGIAKPEIAAQRDPVGDVAERRGALVGGDNEIWVGAVMDHDLVGMGDLVVDDIVGDRQQRADEDAIAFGALGEPRLAVERGAGEVLGIEAALGAGRDDDCILDQLGLHQPENFGAEIIAPVGPAKPAARDRTTAQMNALDARGINPDFAIGNGRGQAGDLPGIDLESDRFGGCRGEGVGAKGRADHRSHQAQDAVVVDAADILECIVERGREPPGLLVTLCLERRIMEREEQSHQRAGRSRRASECIDDGDQRVSHPDLARVAEPGAKPDHRARGQTGADDQLVEGVIFRRAEQHRGDRFLDHRCPIVEPRRGGSVSHDQGKFVNVGANVVEPGRSFLHDGKTEILQHRDNVGQWHQRAALVELEPQLLGRITGQAIEADRPLVFVGQRVELQNVRRRIVGRIARPERVGKSIAIGQHQAARLGRPDAIGQAFLDRGKIAAHHVV